MKITYGVSREGRVSAALAKIKDPAAMIFTVVKEDDLARTAEEIEKEMPGVPCIGGVGPSYGGKETTDKGLSIIALSDGIKAVANVLEEADTRPIKYIRRLEKDLVDIGAEPERVACFDLCSAGTDMNAMTTLNSAFEEKKIEVAGGTSDSQSVAVCGKVYPNSCAYLLLKNLKGRVKAFRENIYKPMEGGTHRYLTTDAEPGEYKIKALDGKPAAKVYCDALGIDKKDAGTQTFRNPFGHMIGHHIYIISIKEIDDEGNIIAFRPANKLDILSILQVTDIRKEVENTLDRIQEEFGPTSAFLSVNCLFRYIMFNEQEHFWGEYLEKMCSRFDHAGFIGVGEHYKKQFVNQTMTGLAFE